MSIRFTCSQCGKHFTVEEEYAGKRGRCPCGNQIHIPETTQNGRGQGKGDSITCNNAKSNATPRIRLYVYAILLCMVIAVCARFTRSIIAPKNTRSETDLDASVLSPPTDQSVGDHYEAKVSSLSENKRSETELDASESSPTTDQRIGDHDEAKVLNSAWALFVTNSTFVSKCYRRGADGTQMSGEDLINMMYSRSANKGYSSMCSVKTSFTISDVVNAVGPYNLAGTLDIIIPTVRGGQIDLESPREKTTYNDYRWNYFSLRTGKDSDKVTGLCLECGELSKILPSGAKLTEAARNFLE